MKIQIFKSRIMKIIKNLKIPQQNHKNHENVIIPLKTYEIPKIPKQDHENHENLKTTCQNQENHEIRKRPLQNK